MVASSANGAIALARDFMDKALSSPTGARLIFPDAEADGRSDIARQRAESWKTRCYWARSHMRRVQARMASPADLISGLCAREASDPDVVRTMYDPLYFEVTRTELPQPAWVLTCLKADAASLNLELF